VRRLGVAVALAAALLVGCSASQGATATTVTVFAAASLREAFDEIAVELEAATGIAVRLSYGASDALAAQIRDGAPVDVFASASPAEIDAVARASGILEKRIFARNRLSVIVPARNRARIETIDDLARPDVKLVLAAAGVPAGRYAREMLRRAGIERDALRNVVSNESSVKGVLQKVALDEADAGVVYRSDVTKAVRVIDVPSSAQVVAEYPVAALRDVPAARRFVDYLLSAQGRATLERHGFLGP
jgi:molybdate transport system substrate-binding protein